MDVNNRAGGRAELQGFLTLLGLFEGHRRRVGAIAALSAVSSAAVLAMFFLVGRSVNALSHGAGTGGRLGLLAAGIVVVGVGGASTALARASLSADLAAAVTTSLQRRTFDRRVGERLEQVTVKPPGPVVTSILHDLPLVPTFLLEAVSGAAGALAVVLAVVAAVTTVDPWLLVVLLVPLVLVAPYRRIERRMRRAAIEKIRGMAALQVFLEQRFTLSGVKFTRTFGLARPVGQDFAARVDDLEGNTAVIQRMVSLTGWLTTSAHAAFLALVIVVSGVGPLSGDLEPAGLVVLVLCTPLLIGVLQTYSTIGYWISTAVAIVESLGLRAGQEPAGDQPAGDRRLRPTAGAGEGPEPVALATRGLRYRYPATRYGAAGCEVIRGLDLELRRREFVAVVGEVGCGKSTLSLLLAGLLPPSAGTVEVRRSAVPGAVRDVALVEGGDHLFSVSLAENLRMVDPSLTLRRMVQICRAVGVHDYVAHLPQGYDTVIGERGMRLSSGQRQLLLLARAVAARPAVLLLDEATSCLDAATEQRAFAGVRVEFDGPLLVVAHRLATAMMADRVLVLEDGVVAGAGSHGELIETSRLYRRFHELQTI